MTNENNTQNNMAEETRFNNRFWKGYKKMDIKQKITLILVLISFCAIIIIGMISYFSSKRTLRDLTFEQLSAINEMKKKNLEDYFSMLRSQVGIFAQDKMVVDALKSFKDAYGSVEADAALLYSDSDFENMKMNVKNYYSTNFITPLNNNLNEGASVESFISDNLSTNILQYIYISNNPNPVNSKSLLNKTADGSAYGEVHGRYHVNFREYANKLGFEDIYLIDESDGNNSNDGNVVYSVAKKVDFGMNLNKVPYKNDGLPTAYEQVSSSKIKDFVYMSDMGLYKPLLGQPSFFVSAPVYNETKKIGVVVFQISGKTINDLVNGKRQWQKEGLKTTGESYLVGDDHLMRSDNRMIFKNKNEYLDNIRFAGMVDNDIARINNINSNILTTKVETDASIEALNGRTNEKIIRNYINEKVLSCYAPLDIKDVNWAIITEMETKEIFKPIHSLRNIIILIVLLLFVIINFVGKYFSGMLADRIISIKESINSLATGKSIDKLGDKTSDEIGMTANAVNQLVERLDEVSNFANAIGKGNFSYEYHAGSDGDKLGNSLLEMKKSLEDARKEEERRIIEDEKRNWSTQGIAKFSEILRSNSDNIDKLSYNLISNLVDYLSANQGGLFLIEDEDEGDRHINLVASYAFNRQKFIAKRIELGEGMVGTCVLEKKTIHLREIPEDYITITSGLGDANPKSILIVPLKTDEYVLGVVEIASFSNFEDHEIEFVEKLADSIASTITSVRINAKTARLLEESNEKANALAQQEEEMRQNIEELKATQEEMARLKKEEELKENERKAAEQMMMEQIMEQNEKMKIQSEELQREKAFLDAIMNNLPDLIYFKDKESKFIKNSMSHAKINGFKTVDQMKGKSDFDLHSEEAARPKYEQEMEIIRTGQGIIDLLEHDINKDGDEFWFSTTKLPLYTEEGECIGTFGISKDVTDMKKMELDAKIKSEELQAQEEELRQNLEEMQAIQEELGKRTYLIDALLRNLPGHIYFKDINSKFIEVSDSLVRLLGATDKELVIGKSDFDFFDDEHAKPAFDDEQNIIKTGVPIINKIEKETHKDGRVTYASTSKMPLRNEEGKIVGTFGVSTDVTESKNLEEELAKEKMLLDALLDNLPAHIYFKDSESKFIKISKSMVHLFNAKNADELIGKSDFDFHGKEHAQKAYDDEQNIIKTGKPILNLVEKEEYEDGRVNWVSTTKMPLKDRNGDVIGTFGISSNVSDSKNLEVQLSQEKMLLDALLDNLPATIYFKDDKGRFLRVSNSLIPKFKVNSLDEIIGKSDFDFHGKKHAQESFEDELRIMKTQKPVVNIIEKEQFDDGRLMWGSTTKMPLYDKDKNVIGTFGITSDVTDLMKLKEELEQVKKANKEVGKLVKMKDDLDKIRKDKK